MTTSRRADEAVLFFAGGECYEKYGTPFKRLRPSGEELEVFACSSDRYYRDAQNIVRRVEAGLPCFDWIDYDGTGRRPVLQLDPARTQRVRNSAHASTKPNLNGSSSDVGNLVSSLVAASATNPIATDPALNANVLRLDTGASGTAARAYRLGAAASLNGLSAGYQAFTVGIYLDPATQTNLTPSDVTVAIVDNVGETVSTVVPVVGQWTELDVLHLLVGGRTECYVEIRVGDNVNLGSANRFVYVRTPTLVEAYTTPRLHANGTGAEVAIATESLSRAFLLGPAALLADGFTFYVKYLERGIGTTIGSQSVFPVFMLLGDPTNTVAIPYAKIFMNGSNPTVRYATGGSNEQLHTASEGANPDLGELIEFAGRCSLAGMQTLYREDGGDFENTSTLDDPIVDTPPKAWSSADIIVGGDVDGGSQTGSWSVISAKLLSGVGWSIDELEAADGLGGSS